MIKKVIFIDANIIGAVLAFAVGALIATVNYIISARVLKKKASQYMAVQVVKQLIQIIYLVLLFGFGSYTPWDPLWLLVGGCLGITLPMFLFTFRLVKLNDSLRKEDMSDG